MSNRVGIVRRRPNDKPANSKSFDKDRVIPGFRLLKSNQSANKKPLDPDLEKTLLVTTNRLLSFISNRDPVALLARTGLQFIFDTMGHMRNESTSTAMFQCEVELLQTLSLIKPRGPKVPTSPNNMLRVWALLRRNVETYYESLKLTKLETVSDEVIRHTRLHTLYYRNTFNSEDAKRIVPELLSLMDGASQKRLGYPMSGLFLALFQLFDLIQDRLSSKFERVLGLLDGKKIDSEIESMCSESEFLARAWRFAENRFEKQRDRGQAAFQLSEMSWGSVFTFTWQELEGRFGETLTAVLFDISIGFGDLADVNTRHIYFGSPIKRHPFIRVEAEKLFLPLPALLVSFPFEIVEGLIEADGELKNAYFEARARYLEDAMADILTQVLPSAHVYQGVEWRDPETGTIFENDTAVVLGNYIFLFEAKSGKLNPASRRGADKSLRRNFKELFVEPTKQAARLERFLAQGHGTEGLLKDAHGRNVEIDFSAPNIVSKFGVCIEHLASITSNRRYFLELGLLDPNDSWAPMLSLGELIMISDYLDTEISFFHYLTRRSTIEEQITFHGDEQDLLSIYLTNGFCIDNAALNQTEVVFQEIDDLVRAKKKPRKNRHIFATPGVTLSSFWQSICSEIYYSDMPKRFGMLEVIMNQNPSMLAGLEKKISQWKSNRKLNEGNTLFIHYLIGNRAFIVAVNLSQTKFDVEEKWQDYARNLAGEVYLETGAEADIIDCVIFLYTRPSSIFDFERISYIRMAKSKRTRLG